MKLRLLLLLVILFVGAWVGEKMVQDPGYVLVSYSGTTIETSLWVLLVILLVGFLVGHVLVNLISRAGVPASRLRLWNDRRATRSAHRKTLKGMQALAEGNWWKAQRYLGQAAPHAELPLMNYLAAARAAHEQGDEKGADALLEQARSCTPEAALAVNLAQAQLLHERGQFEACRDILKPLHHKMPKHTQILRLLQDTLVQLGDWQGLADLLPELHRYKALPDERLQELEQRCYGELLHASQRSLPIEADNAVRLQALNKAWQAIPNKLGNDERLVRDYVAELVSLGEEARAETFLRDQLKRRWSESLVNLYGRVQGEQAHKQLETAKGWLRDHPNDAELLLTLGRLSMRNQHWGKAVSYFEQSIEQRPAAETYSELCRLLHHLGEHDRVVEIMQDGIAASGSGLPSLPMPEPDAAQSA